MRRLVRIIAVAVIASLFSTGCMLSRAVDRAFIGMSVRRPSFLDRKVTGIFLLPFTFAIDLATFPIQALLVVIAGDNFPFSDTDTLNQVVAARDPMFDRLPEDKRALAAAELQQLLRSGALTANTALALGEDGHWSVVAITDEAHRQMLARAQQPQAPQPAVCVR